MKFNTLGPCGRDEVPILSIVVAVYLITMTLSVLIR